MVFGRLNALVFQRQRRDLIPAWGSAPGLTKMVNEGCRPVPSKHPHISSGFQPYFAHTRVPGALPQAGIGWAFGPQQIRCRTLLAGRLCYPESANSAHHNSLASGRLNLGKPLDRLGTTPG